MNTDNLYKPAPTQREKFDRTFPQFPQKVDRPNPRNRVSSYISRTQPKIWIETRLMPRSDRIAIAQIPETGFLSISLVLN
ncbi:MULTISPECIES: hypothetical protein [unclassified Microcoleus]|uniref:hypothetical protein n=1 Tax=unclassified Microcoleus TaxID=2642155 RepID=UPI002FD41B17